MLINLYELKCGELQPEPIVHYKGESPDVGDTVVIGVGSDMLMPTQYLVRSKTYVVSDFSDIGKGFLVSVAVTVIKIE